MPGLRPHTKLYDQDARDRLGLAVTRGREAAGYPKRPAFAKASGIGVTSLFKLETGEPVGPAVYEAAARVLPGWDEDTPRVILEGGQVPTLGERSDRRVEEAPNDAELEDEEMALVRLLIRRRWSPKRIAEAIDELRKQRETLPTVEPPTGTDR